MKKKIKNKLDFGNILDDFGMDPSFRLEVGEVGARLEDGPGNTFVMKADGTGFCRMYLNGKHVKTIPFPKDNIFRSEDFEL